MIVLYYFVQFLKVALYIYQWVFLIWIVLSWFPVNRDNPIIRFITGLVEPVYEAVMKILPRLQFGMIDFSIIYFILLFRLLFWLFDLVLRLFR